MKKLYAQPDFELINIRLIEDVLATSGPTEDPMPEPGGGDGDFEDDEF